MTTEIQQFWFSPYMRKHWFGCPPEVDNLIRLKFADVKCSNFLDTIIYYDQMSRHIYRGNTNKIAENDTIALNALITNLDNLSSLNPEQRCFAIMPWRHTFKPELLYRCLQMVDTWNQEQSHPYYKRFAQATLKALSKHNTLRFGHWTIRDPNFFASILDARSASVPIMKPIILPNESLMNGGIATWETKVSNAFSNCQGKVVVSVSGGVDSMVCLFIANAVFGNKNVKCVSIDYANRVEQSLEIQMVNHVCGILEIEHYVRVIDEVKRPNGSCSGIIDREFYETFTRDIRFKAYSDVATNGEPIILGHNQDDTLENIFSNLKKHKNYDNLFGMEEMSEERGVQIWRPLINVPKSEILAFALANNIPFTYDSTPAWSERGQLRDTVMPAIKNYIPGLLELVNNVKSLYQQQNAMCISNLHFHNDTAFIKDPVYTLEYFQNTFKQIAQHYKVPYPKNKSLKHLIDQLSKGNTSRLTVSVHIVSQKTTHGLIAYVK